MVQWMFTSNDKRTVRLTTDTWARPGIESKGSVGDPGGCRYTCGGQCKQFLRILAQSLMLKCTFYPTGCFYHLLTSETTYLLFAVGNLVRYMRALPSLPLYYHPSAIRLNARTDLVKRSSRVTPFRCMIEHATITSCVHDSLRCLL